MAIRSRPATPNDLGMQLEDMIVPVGFVLGIFVYLFGRAVLGWGRPLRVVTYKASLSD